MRIMPDIKFINGWYVVPYPTGNVNRQGDVSSPDGQIEFRLRRI
jgi:hypothetical protein